MTLKELKEKVEAIAVAEQLAGDSDRASFYEIENTWELTLYKNYLNYRYRFRKSDISNRVELEIAVESFLHDHLYWLYKKLAIAEAADKIIFENNSRASYPYRVIIRDNAHVVGKVFEDVYREIDSHVAKQIIESGTSPVR